MLVHHRHIALIRLLVWITGTLAAETFAEDTDLDQNISVGWRIRVRLVKMGLL